MEQLTIVKTISRIHVVWGIKNMGGLENALRESVLFVSCLKGVYFYSVNKNENGDLIVWTMLSTPSLEETGELMAKTEAFIREKIEEYGEQ